MNYKSFHFPRLDPKSSFYYSNGRGILYSKSPYFLRKRWLYRS